MMGPNATMIMKKWGDCLPELLKGAARPRHMVVSNRMGKVYLRQELEQDFGGNPGCYTSRGRTQQIMYDYATSLGVKVIFDSRVTGVSETVEEATVVVGEKKYDGDLVIAADGVHSKARGLVVGVQDRPSKSGFAVYRSWFDFDVLRQNPETNFLADSKEALFQIWIDTDMHAIISTNPNLQKATCFLTHKVCISYM